MFVSLMLISMTTTMTFAYTILRIPSATQQQRQLPLHMIDRNIADMIDQEYYRQHHKEEYHQQWMERHQPQIKTKPSNLDHTNSDMMMTMVGVLDTYTISNDDDDVILNRRQLLRDEKLARTNPQQYCMDRCIATGYCDVYEDLYVIICLLCGGGHIFTWWIPCLHWFCSHSTHKTLISLVLFSFSMSHNVFLLCLPRHISSSSLINLPPEPHQKQALIFHPNRSLAFVPIVY